MQLGSYVCGWCRTRVAKKVELEGAHFRFQGSEGDQTVLSCTACGQYSLEVFTNRQIQLPAPPKPSSEDREVRGLPPEVDLVWKEVRLCTSIGASLATAGLLRSLIVAIWRDQNPSRVANAARMPTFEAALDTLQESEDLTKKLRARADTLRTLGNDALHEIVQPDTAALDEALTTAHLWLRVMYEDVPRSSTEEQDLL